MAMAAALGASAAWGREGTLGNTRWVERRDLYPEGVASGDPAAESVLLWTRRPFEDGRASGKLTVEVAEDEQFDTWLLRRPCWFLPPRIGRAGY